MTHDITDPNAPLGWQCGDPACSEHGGRRFPEPLYSAASAGRSQKLAGLLVKGMDLTWRTPQELFDKLDGEFHFRLDAASSDGNALVAESWTPYENSLWRSWEPGPVFLNPPYGPQLFDWLMKCVLEAQRGVTVVALLPARTDTRWFHECVLPYAEIRYIRGRIRFQGATYNAPFPSLVAVFRGVHSDPGEAQATIDLLRNGMAVLMRIRPEEADEWAQRLIESDRRVGKPWLAAIRKGH